MIIGLGVFGFDLENSVFQLNNSIGSYTGVELTNAIFDELVLRNDTDETFSTEHAEWDSQTVLIAPFVNDLGVGNLNMQGLVVNELLIKRRKTSDLTWTTITEIPFSQSIASYSYIDKFIANAEEYEWAVVPSTNTGIEGSYRTESLTTDFDGNFIMDATSIYKLYYNVTLGDIETVIPNTTVETLGSQYPIVMYAAETNYKQGSVKCALFSETTIEDGVISLTAEKINRNAIMSFLTDKKPKILKTISGDYILISIIGNPSLSPINNTSGTVFDLQFKWVEIGDSQDQTTLTAAGLL